MATKLKISPPANSKIRKMKVGDRFVIKLAAMNATTERKEEIIEILEIGTYPAKPGSKTSYKGAKVRITRTGEVRILFWMVLEFAKELPQEVVV